MQRVLLRVGSWSAEHRFQILTLATFGTAAIGLLTKSNSQHRNQQETTQIEQICNSIENDARQFSDHFQRIDERIQHFTSLDFSTTEQKSNRFFKNPTVTSTLNNPSSDPQLLHLQQLALKIQHQQVQQLQKELREALPRRTSLEDVKGGQNTLQKRGGMSLYAF